MTDEKINIAMAELEGYTDIKIWYGENCDRLGETSADKKVIGIVGKFPSVTKTQPWIPDYVNDLNAVRRVEETLLAEQRGPYIDTLVGLTGAEWTDLCEEVFVVAHATARQRCEAILRTLCKWEDEE